MHQVSAQNIQDTYIGCGCYANQPSSYKNPTTRFQRAVKQFGPSKFIRKTLKVFDDEDSAYLLEAEIVNKDFLARNDVYNMVLGGKGGCFIRIPIYKYDTEGNYICGYNSYSEAALAVNRNLRSIQRGLADKHLVAGFYWNVNKYDKLDLKYYKTEEISRGFPVYQYSITGEYDCCYDSIRDCARVIGASDANLGIAIKMGTKCFGKYYTTVFSEHYSVANSIKRQLTTVYQYDLNGNFIKE